MYYTIYLGHFEAKVRCDDIAHAIYVDGQNVGSTTSSDDVWTSNIGDNIDFIAVDCENTGAWGGLIASFGNGLTTDNTWRCSSKPHSRWYEKDFDDIDCNKAYIIESNPTYTDVPLWVRDNAKWIWRDSSYEESTHSYCRERLRK